MTAVLPIDARFHFGCELSLSLAILPRWGAGVLRPYEYLGKLGHCLPQERNSEREFKIACAQEPPGNLEVAWPTAENAYCRALGICGRQRLETMREWFEYAAVWAVLKIFGALPRSMARSLAADVARMMYALLSKLRKTAEFNLRLAFPEWGNAQLQATIRGMVRNLGWMAAEFARMPQYTKENIEQVVILDGHENFLEGQRRGKGVLYLTGHIGAWELSSFAHSLYGYPLHYMARPLDHPRVDELVNRYRCLSGNRPVFKNESARALLKILRDAGTVGILADQNTLPVEGVFVDFFGTPACTTTGLARVALHTDAAVVPGYAYWDESIGKYRLRFEPPVELVRTGDTERDVFVNTQKFTKVIEEIVRKYPEQWVWVHARWKTRPPGEAPLYDFLN